MINIKTLQGLVRKRAGRSDIRLMRDDDDQCVYITTADGIKLITSDGSQFVNIPLRKLAELEVGTTSLHRLLDQCIGQLNPWRCNACGWLWDIPVKGDCPNCRRQRTPREDNTSWTRACGGKGRSAQEIANAIKDEHPPYWGAEPQLEAMAGAWGFCAFVDAWMFKRGLEQGLIGAYHTGFGALGAHAQLADRCGELEHQLKAERAEVRRLQLELEKRGGAERAP